jgi:cytochrome c peroxidase
MLLAGLVALAASLHAQSPAPPSPQIRLGAALFFDARLSRHSTRACADCHRPERGWSDGLPRARALDGRELSRKTPTLYALGDGQSFFWDGRAPTLEVQVLGPLSNPDEMDTPPETAVAYLRNDPAYEQAFREVFGEPATVTTLARALAAFVATRRPPSSRFAAWEAGDKTALTLREQRGLSLFRGKARCASCHRGDRLTTDAFHFLGLNSEDRGLGAVKKDPILDGFFKTPTLHDVARRAPYMHDGSLATLADVVAFYDRGGDRPANAAGTPTSLEPIGLTAPERADLVAFLRTLGPEPRSRP